MESSLEGKILYGFKDGIVEWRVLEERTFNFFQEYYAIHFIFARNESVMLKFNVDLGKACEGDRNYDSSN